MSVLHISESINIREVYADNLVEEFKLISGIVDDYPLIGMDTEFPGVPISGEVTHDFGYHKLRSNVDSLKLIQVGLTFSDDKGNLPSYGIWQFNFREFNPAKDLSVQSSIELLCKSGINFDKNMEKGIDAGRFGELLMSSGAVLNDKMHWITFQGSYDYGFLLKILTGKNLPQSQEGFFDLLEKFFPVRYDVKHLMKCTNTLHGGLSGLARTLNLMRVGVAHQAGSDSLLTSAAFIKIRDNYFNGTVDTYSGVVYGLEIVK
ncbi:putative CCR4-associated factor 1 7 [Salvia divinorum]|uniref:poly(A)-specific ribonuclease n=1 Tax=Salvia divinorum TaxID=28513 RepID=A0ABD1I5P0_SALDI